MDKNNPFNIKVGDKVLCISAVGQQEILGLGVTYTITDVQMDNVLSSFYDTMFCRVKELGQDALLLSRFIPADLTVLEKVIYGL